jgi:hypothetical protein
VAEALDIKEVLEALEVAETALGLIIQHKPQLTEPQTLEGVEEVMALQVVRLVRQEALA